MDITRSHLSYYTTQARQWHNNTVQFVLDTRLQSREFGGQTQESQSAQATTVATTQLALEEEFRDSHGCAVDGILFPATAGAALIEELGSLSHGQTDQLRLRAAAATAATGREFLERLKGRGAA